MGTNLGWGGQTSLGPKTGTSVRWGGGDWQNFGWMEGLPSPPPPGKKPWITRNYHSSKLRTITSHTQLYGEIILPKDSLPMELPPSCIKLHQPWESSGEEFHPVCNQLLGFYSHFIQFITPFEFSSLFSSPAPPNSSSFFFFLSAAPVCLFGT